MKKVLLVIHTPPPFGGGEIQAQYLKDHFKENKDFIIFDYSRKTHSRSDWQRIKIRTVLHGIYWILKVSFLIIYYKPKKIYFTLPKKFSAFLRNASIIPLTKIFGIKILGDLPGTSFLFLQNPKSFKYLIGLYLLKRIDEIRFLSKKIAEEHKDLQLKNKIVINNGIKIPNNLQVNTEVFFHKILNVLYIGSLEYSKGIFNSVAAIKICKDNNIRIKLNLIGYWVQDDEKSRIENYITDHDLSDFITFHGIKTDFDKWNLFVENALLLHPTFWDGVPFSILEALALGMPVISTFVGGIPDTINNGINGTLIIQNTPESIAEALLYYYNNRSVLMEMSIRNKRLFKEKFTLDIFLKNMNTWFYK